MTPEIWRTSTSVSVIGNSTDPRFRFECLVQHIAMLVFFGTEEDDAHAEVLADYATHHLDGQDGYDLGGEA